MDKVHDINNDIQQQRDAELISRYIDGEMSAEERASFEGRLACETHLAKFMAQFEGNDHALVDWMNADAQSTIPESVYAALNQPEAPAQDQTGNVVQFRRRWAPMGLAAGLAIAALATLNIGTPSPETALAAALDTVSARAEGWDEMADGREVQVALTFPASNGQWCREFQVRGDSEAWHGVACREDGSWITQVRVNGVDIESGSHYRPASGETVNAVSRFIDNNARDIALGAEEELRLIESGWH